MISVFDGDRIVEVMDIWLKANIEAHHFIEPAFWLRAFDEVKKALPSSKVYIYQEQDEIRGFLGLVEGRYIAGLFVADGHRSRGIGRRLLDHVRARHERLELNVFVENEPAVKFYQRNGFQIVGRSLNLDFAHEEYHMLWSADSGSKTPAEAGSAEGGGL